MTRDIFYSLNSKVRANRKKSQACLSYAEVQPNFTAKL